jgi:glutathione S-transferase
MPRINNDHCTSLKQLKITTDIMAIGRTECSLSNTKISKRPDYLLGTKRIKSIHPLGKSPVITDEAKTIAESGAIIEYLTKNYSKNLFPFLDDEDKKEELIYWLHYAEGSVMPPLVMKLVFEKIKSSPMPFFVKPIAKMIANKVLDNFVMPNINDNFDFIEAHLKTNQWFLGDNFSPADIQMSFPLEAGLSRLENKDNYPNIKKYVNAFQSRPAYKEALLKGGKYDY